MTQTVAANRESSYLSLSSTGFHSIVYSDYGPVDGPLIVCVHYLTGNGFYFDTLARTLAQQGYRVIVPDMPGRGRSDWLRNPEDYAFPKYAADITALLAHLGIKEGQSIDWIGASMGGLLGIALAAMPRSPIHRLTIIDIGPTVPVSELKTLAEVVDIVSAKRFRTMDELENAIREGRSASWGPVPEFYWRDVAEHGARTLADGSLAHSFDPAINIVFSRLQESGLDLWALWDAVPCPVLTIRGENSTVLPLDVAEEMIRRKPAARLETIRSCAHVPSLAMPDQIGLIQSWLTLPFSAA